MNSENIRDTELENVSGGLLDPEYCLNGTAPTGLYAKAAISGDPKPKEC